MGQSRFALLQLGAAATAFAVTLAHGALAQEVETLPSTPISPQKLSGHVKVLASDAFEGRGPGTAGEQKSVDYIISQMKAIGLKPAGEKGGWTQEVTLSRFATKGPVNLEINSPGKQRRLSQTREIVVRVMRPVDRVSIQNAPLVFVGYGVHAPEIGWDDFKDIDLKGKIMICLINDPDYEAKDTEAVHGKFGGRALTYYGRWTYKFEEAARRGPTGVIIIHEAAAAAAVWPTITNTYSIAQMDIQQADPAAAHTLLEGYIRYDFAAELFKAAGLDLEAEKVRARSAEFRPITLKRLNFSAQFEVDHSTMITRNVLGKVEGVVHPDQTILYTAHWDHLGIGPPDATGDRIYHGARDDAAGVAGILEIGRAFANAPRPRRSVVIMTTTSEEKGWLGALYYASNPIYPLARTVADINLEGGAEAPAHDIGIGGEGKGDLEAMLARIAAKDGRRITVDPLPEAGRYFRGDNIVFAKAGIPSLVTLGGDDLYKGPEGAKAERPAEYLAHRYHQPADVWSPNMDFRGMALDDGLLYNVGRELADSDVWPEWNPKSEFKATRDSTAIQRSTPR